MIQQTMTNVQNRVDGRQKLASLPIIRRIGLAVEVQRVRMDGRNGDWLLVVLSKDVNGLSDRLGAIKSRDERVLHLQW